MLLRQERGAIGRFQLQPLGQARQVRQDLVHRSFSLPLHAWSYTTFTEQACVKKAAHDAPCCRATRGTHTAGTRHTPPRARAGHGTTRSRGARPACATRRTPAAPGTHARRRPRRSRQGRSHRRWRRRGPIRVPAAPARPASWNQGRSGPPLGCTGRRRGWRAACRTGTAG